MGAIRYKQLSFTVLDGETRDDPMTSEEAKILLSDIARDPNYRTQDRINACRVFLGVDDGDSKMADEEAQRIFDALVSEVN